MNPGNRLVNIELGGAAIGCYPGVNRLAAVLPEPSNLDQSPELLPSHSQG